MGKAFTNGSVFTAASTPRLRAKLSRSPRKGMIENLLDQGGSALVIAAFLAFGVLLAFTPCVFPIYPIVAGTLAREGEN